MKIAVSGKGGVGKTFIAGTLAARLASNGHPVIAIDADPSPNLGVTLGLTAEEAARIVPIAEDEKLIQLKTGTEFPGVFRLTFTVSDIITKYSVPTPSGVALMVMGTVRSMGAGCICPAHSLVKALLRHLLVDRNDMVILDMEAGIEHLGRGTAQCVDSLLVVTDADRKSLMIAASICRLATGSEIRKIGVVGNRITGMQQEMILRTFAEKNGLDILAIIPYDLKVAESGVTGVAVDEKTSVAVTAIQHLAHEMQKE